MARRWMRDHNYFWGEMQTVENTFIHHFIAICRQPAGRADGSCGSQQSLFEMELPTKRMKRPVYEHLGFDGVGSPFVFIRGKRYGIDEETGEIKWIESKKINTYCLADKFAMSEFLRLHTREVGHGLCVYRSSKGVVTREDGVRVVCTLIPPLLIEECERSRGRTVLAVTCNSFTFNDQGGLDLPPLFMYADGEREGLRQLAAQNLMGPSNHGHRLQGFWQLAVQNLMGLSNHGHRLSSLMQSHLPPAYRDGEAEGEETSLVPSPEPSPARLTCVEPAAAPSVSASVSAAGPSSSSA